MAMRHSVKILNELIAIDTNALCVCVCVLFLIILVAVVDSSVNDRSSVNFTPLIYKHIYHMNVRIYTLYIERSKFLFKQKC